MFNHLVKLAEEKKVWLGELMIIAVDWDVKPQT